MNRRGFLQRLLALPAALLWWRKKKTSILVQHEWGRFEPTLTTDLKTISLEELRPGKKTLLYGKWADA